MQAATSKKSSRKSKRIGNLGEMQGFREVYKSDDEDDFEDGDAAHTTGDGGGVSGLAGSHIAAGVPEALLRVLGLDSTDAAELCR